MLHSRCITTIAATFLVMMFVQPRAMAQRDAPPASCHVTLPSPDKRSFFVFCSCDRVWDWFRREGSCSRKRSTVDCVADRWHLAGTSSN